MASVFVGVDVAKEASVYGLSTGVTRSFANTREGFRAAKGWIASQRCGSPAHLVLESTGPYGVALAKFFHQAQGFRVSVLNPKQARAFARAQLRRSKTDRIDAVVLAQLGQALDPAPWQPLPPERERLQVLGRRLQRLKAALRAEENRRDAYKCAGWEAPEVAASLARTRAFLQSECSRLEQDCRSLVASHPHLQAEADLLTTIPGIGATTAVALLGEMGDPLRYRSAKSLVGYAGIAPAENSSGTSLRGKPRVSKVGSPALRALLYMPAIVATQHNPTIRAFYQRLLARGKTKMVSLLAAMNKLLRIAFALLKNHRPFQLPNPLPT